jgi:division protein CdvB (Snf7/Vps24/ESCRT-III family)
LANTFLFQLTPLELKHLVGDASLGNPFKWKQEEKESVVSKIKNVTKPQENLKDQIVLVTQKLDVQTRSLDVAVKRFEMRDAEIFQRVVKAMEARDQARANILATELGEIRKVEKMLTHASLALQSVSMRLSTVSEMGDLVAVLSPAKTLLNGVRSEMCSIMPEASQELGSIGNLLSDICVNSSSQYMDVNNVGAQASNEEALKILEEAEVAAESRLKDRLPEIAPAYTTATKRSDLEASSF